MPGRRRAACSCPVIAGQIRHQRATCTAPVPGLTIGQIDRAAARLQAELQANAGEISRIMDEAEEPKPLAAWSATTGPDAEQIIRGVLGITEAAAGELVEHVLDTDRGQVRFTAHVELCIEDHSGQVSGLSRWRLRRHGGPHARFVLELLDGPAE